MPIPNLASIAALMKSELMGCSSVLEAGEDGSADGAQILNLAHIFSSLTGGGGCEDSSDVAPATGDAGSYD
jgi:hypothetical protein